MQLFGLDDLQQSVPIHQAKRGKRYLCQECGTLLAPRFGLYRKPHFYHLDPNRTCRMSGKTLEHLQTQNWIQQRVGGDLEVPFPQISRIADVVWEEKKIIFEVQCSPITPLEIAQRNKDYASLGYQVVWVLHEMGYNRRRTSLAELSLQSWPHYFTNIDKKGRGAVFDQACQLKRGVRIRRSSKFFVDVSSPQEGGETPLLPQRGCWSLCFEGDIFTSWKKIKDLTLFEKEIKNEKEKSFLKKYITDPYKMFFEYFLDGLL
jgi:competence protein CoiA